MAMGGRWGFFAEEEIEVPRRTCVGLCKAVQLGEDAISCGAEHPGRWVEGAWEHTGGDRCVGHDLESFPEQSARSVIESQW